MSSRIIKKSVLYRTCSGTDANVKDGSVYLTGLDPVPLNGVVSISEIKYKAEVAQVVTVGGTDYTVTANTLYQVVVYDPLVKIGSYSQQPIPFFYLTSPDLSTEGTTNALRKEYISGQLVSKINENGIAVAASLGSGNGFTITDNGGYYPVYSQGMAQIAGKNTVYTVKNTDGTGYNDNFSVTTQAVYSVGAGANLALENPVMDFVMGNVVSGYIDDAPLTTTGLPAVSGQNYDMYKIEDMHLVDAITLGGQYAYQTRVQRVFADNGTGSSTTNLTGYLAFEHKMHQIMMIPYKDDPSAVQEWFNLPIVFQDPLGAAPTGTADTLGLQVSAYASLNRTNIGTQTKVVPIPTTGGYDIDQDDTATEGSHTSQNQQVGANNSFVVGQGDFFITARYSMADFTDAAFMVGFRKKAVYGAVINNYTDYATIGNGSSAAGTTWINGDLFVTRAALNGAATTQAISAVAPVDASTYLATIKVANNGAVTAYIGNTSYPIYSSGTTQMVFDAGDELIAFYQIVNIGNGDPGSVISEFFGAYGSNLIS